MLFHEAFAEFVRYLRFEKRYSTHTIEAYERNLQQFQTFFLATYDASPQVAEIAHHHIRSWLAGIKEQVPDTKATTLNHKAATLSSFFRYACRQGWLEKTRFASFMQCGFPNACRLRCRKHKPTSS